jgi:nucleotide-binding universal stress UspA family protein
MGTSQIEEAEIAARQELATCIPLHAKERCQIDLEIRVGDPATEIQKVANFVRHDFIILGSPPDSIVSRILGSSVIHRVVSEADCPVLTIKPLHPAVMTSTDGLLHAEPARINPDTSTQNYL